MRKGNGIRSIVGLLVVVIALVWLAGAVQGQPIWKRFRCNDSQTGRTSHVASRTNDLYWTFNTGNFNFTSPAIADNENVYFGSRNGLFFALSSTGDFEWQYDAIARIDSSPAIDSNGNIYFGANNGLLYCITTPSTIPTQGTLNWTFDAAAPIYSSPTLDKDEYSVFVGTSDGRLLSVYSANWPPTQGTLQWSLDLGDDIFASPAYRYYDLAPTGSTLGDIAMVYIGAEVGLYDGYVYGVQVPLQAGNGDVGTVAWVYPDFGDEPIGPVQSSVAISDDGNFIYFGSKDGNLYCLSSSGYFQWSYQTGDIIDSSPGLLSTGDIVFGSRDGAVYCVDPAGELRWSFETGDAIESSPAVDANDNVIIGSRDNFLYSISPSGTQNWRFQAGYHIWSSPAIGKSSSGGGPGPGPQVTTATIYFACADLKVYALREDRDLPVLQNCDPYDGQTGVRKTLGYIIFEVVDSQNDVDRESIVMLFQGMLVHPTFERIEEQTYRGWRGKYYCGDYSFSYGEEVTVTIQACDTAMEPNCIDETYSFTIESGTRRSAPGPGLTPAVPRSRGIGVR